MTLRFMDDAGAYLADEFPHYQGFGSAHPLGDPSLVLPFLGQRVSWCKAGGQYVLIADMSPGHALATANFILVRATGVVLAMLVAGALHVSYKEVIDERAARGILVETALVTALVARAGEGTATELPWVAAQIEARARRVR